MKTEVFENAFQNGDFWTRRSIVLVWTARTELSKNAYITSHYASPNSIAGAIGAYVSNGKNIRAEPGDKNASLDHRFSARSVDGRKRCENTNVDAEVFIRFRVTKYNSVDRALNSLDFVSIFCFSLTKLMNGLVYTLETLDFTIPYHGSRSTFLSEFWFVSVYLYTLPMQHTTFIF